jgi:signal transduction histidine kinase
MTETNCASPDSFWTTRRRGPSRRRVAGLFVLLIAAVGLVVWMELSSWRQVRRLEEAFTEARPVSFLLGVRLREGMERLSATLLLFELSDDDAARARFQSIAGDLRERLGRPTATLLTSEERELAQTARVELEQFLATTKPMLEQGIRGIRKDTAEPLHQEIQKAAAPVFAIAERLVTAQEAASRNFFAASRDSLSTLRRWLVVSLLLLVLMMAAVTLMIQRALVTPLQARLSETEAVIARQERLVSLGTLAAGVAHEIRNPLTAIKFRLFSLKQSLPEELSDHEDIGVIQGEIQRLERIVKEFLLFARPAEPVLARLPVADLLASVRDLLRAELERRGVRLELASSETLNLRADRQQLQQVLINLVLNAAEASGRNGLVSVAARSGEGVLGGRLQPVITLEVSDTGPGVPEGLEQQIFDPFFSTKEGGTGLGLPIAARIVEKHGGQLQFSSQHTRGTTFSAVLPHATDDESQPAVDRG